MERLKEVRFLIRPKRWWQFKCSKQRRALTRIREYGLPVKSSKCPFPRKYLAEYFQDQVNHSTVGRKLCLKSDSTSRVQLLTLMHEITHQSSFKPEFPR